VEKFLGVGLVKALGLALFTICIILGLKVIFNKYYVSGVTEAVNAV